MGLPARLADSISSRTAGFSSSDDAGSGTALMISRFKAARPRNPLAADRRKHHGDDASRRSDPSTRRSVATKVPSTSTTSGTSSSSRWASPAALSDVTQQHPEGPSFRVYGRAIARKRPTAVDAPGNQRTQRGLTSGRDVRGRRDTHRRSDRVAPTPADGCRGKIAAASKTLFRCAEVRIRVCPSQLCLSESAMS